MRLLARLPKLLNEQEMQSNPIIPEFMLSFLKIDSSNSEVLQVRIDQYVFTEKLAKDIVNIFL